MILNPISRVLLPVYGRAQRVYHYWHYKNYDRTPDLGKLKLLVLYIVGDNDEANPETTSYYQSLTPGAKLAIIKNAGHLTMQDNREQHNQVLSAFLDSLDRQ